MKSCLAGALRYCPTLSNHRQKLGAIADFCYNLGVGRLQASTLRRKINEQDWPSAICELRKWVYASGKKLNGLILRREAEIAHFSQ